MTLKPCPFCGNTKIVVADSNDISKFRPDDDQWEENPPFAGICDFNNGGCGASGGYRLNEEDAADVWNRRS